MTVTRRQFLSGGAALAGASALGLPTLTQAADPLGIALITPSPLGDVGWSHTLAQGLDGVKAELGDAVTITLLENIMEGPDADRIMQKTIADGNTFLLAGSFGYMNGGLQVARRFPNASVIHASGYKTAPNFSNFAARYYQGTYLMGMAAASLTKSKKLGSVSAFAIPELITSINAYTLGAQSIDPDIEVSVVWVNSWFDPAKEQAAAKALLSQDVDVIFSNAQDTPSVISLCEEEGVYSFNLNSSMKDYAPTKYLGVVGTNWTPYFLSEVKAHIDGNFSGKSHWLGMEDDVVYTADWNPDIPQDVVASIQEIEAKIVAGEFNPFTGPIAKADGSTVVGEGEVIPDDQVLGMDYHVQGVTTPLPQ